MSNDAVPSWRTESSQVPQIYWVSMALDVPLERWKTFVPKYNDGRCAALSHLCPAESMEKKAKPQSPDNPQQETQVVLTR